MLQSGLNTDTIKSAVPSNFRTSKWTGIAKEQELFIFTRESFRSWTSRFNLWKFSAPKWKGRVVIRASNNIYNQSLVASLIKNNGKAATAKWSKGMVANMARAPKGNDRAQILAVAREKLI